jgi:hypothetical protein
MFADSQLSRRFQFQTTNKPIHILNTAGSCKHGYWDLASLVEPGSRTRTSASGVAVFRGLKSLLAESLVESLGTLVVRMAFEAVRNLT